VTSNDYLIFHHILCLVLLIFFKVTLENIGNVLFSDTVYRPTYRLVRKFHLLGISCSASLWLYQRQQWLPMTLVLLR